MINAFLNSYFGTNGILESADGEWQGWEALVNLSEEGSGLLELEVVLSVELSLEDSGSELAFLRFSLSS